MSATIIEADFNDSESQDDSIDTWLAVLVRLLDISSSKRDAIRDEIEAHLRERVRDLMIAGTPEHDAIRMAISELGEVADLARRFSHASKLRTRRIIMNAAVLAIGGVSVAMATVFLNGPQPNSRVSVFEPPAAKADESSILQDRTAQLNFNDIPLGDVFKFLATQADLDLVLDARAIESEGLSMEEPVSLQLAQPRPVSQILELVSNQFESTFAWRVHDHLLEISTPGEFDRREIVLASFDVQNVLDRIYEDTGDADEAASRLESLVIDYVEPEAWYNNGGDLANLRIVGGRMFVKAPARFHQPIEWMLSQLEDSATQHAARFDPLGGSVGSGPAGWRIYSDSLRSPAAQPAAPGALGGAASPVVPRSSGQATLVPSSLTAPTGPAAGGALNAPAAPTGGSFSGPYTGGGRSPGASSSPATGSGGSAGSNGGGGKQ